MAQVHAEILVSTVQDKFDLVEDIVNSIQHIQAHQVYRIYFYGARWTGKCTIAKRVSNISPVEIVYIDEPDVDELVYNAHSIVISDVGPHENPKIPVGTAFDRIVHFVGLDEAFEYEDIEFVFM
jgi:hypothetical protein